MKRIFPVLLIALAVCSLARTPSEDYIQVFFPNGKIITAELAVSDAERARGLMNREIINSDQAMLFVFDYEGVHSMWMKNMLIPLDFLWLDREQQIVHIEENVPPCKRDPCPSYASKIPAMYVLELKAGSIKQNGLNLYDKIDFVLKEIDRKT
ncbi:MAG: DUF192 domain-containing protein [Candidatus Aminicenantaceae bacterium]|jgi:uncharacterized membrane protein (UPF0127 family)